MNGWALFVPEFFVFGAALVLLALSLAPSPRPRRDFIAALCLAALAVVAGLAALKAQGTLFAEAYRVDLFSQVFKVLLALGLFLVVCLCSGGNGVEDRHHPEFYLLLFICTLAMMLLSSAVHLLSIYIALELSSYSLYVLVSLRRARQMAMEAALKFFLVGITASALMLLGLALLYGTTGAVTVHELARILPGAAGEPLVGGEDHGRALLDLDALDRLGLARRGQDPRRPGDPRLHRGARDEFLVRRGADERGAGDVCGLTQGDRDRGRESVERLG